MNINDYVSLMKYFTLIDNFLYLMMLDNSVF